jgi:autotransporter-associated beta strand protein
MGVGTLTLTAANTYTGPTLVTNGTLVVNGSLASGPVTVQNAGTLAGTGSVSGSNVTINAGGAIAPGNIGVIGTLTAASNVLFNANSTAAMDVNGTTGTNDVLKANNVTYGGTLSVTNIGGRIKSGAVFKLFSTASGTYGGSFTSVQLPPLWPGLSWVTSGLNVSGTISVSGTAIPPQITTNTVVGNTVTLGGSGGLAGSIYYVLEATNVAQPLATWARIATNTFDGSGNFSFVGTPHVPLLPAAFYTIQAP